MRSHISDIYLPELPFLHGESKTHPVPYFTNTRAKCILENYRIKTSKEKTLTTLLFCV